MTQRSEPMYLPAQGVDITAHPTAWESIPKLIRFVVWVYAILAVISLVAAAVVFLVVVVLGATLGASL